MISFMRLGLTVFLMLCGGSFAFATTLETLNAQIQTFEDSSQSRFAPATMKKVIAYQGASMLAYEQMSAFSEQDQQTQTLQNAIEQTLKVLNEAQNTANVFITTYAPLLQLEKEAEKAYIYHHKPRMLAEPEVEKWWQEGRISMRSAIAASEQGQLNQASQSTEQAKIAFTRCIDAAMLGLVEQTERALSQASSVGAKRFAPRTWSQAEDELDVLEKYAETIQLPKAERENISRPKHIGHAFEMAVYAQKIAIHAKNLYRDNAGYEKLILDAKQERLSYAKTLDLDLNYEEVGIDIEAQVILQAIESLHQKSLQHTQQSLALKNTFQLELKSKLQAQYQQDQKIFQNKLNTIKSAYSSRLEQETFENKRQKKLRLLFKKGEVDIITNLDGSLIIRAKKIQFALNSSKIDGKYFEFLARIKEAATLYPDRNIRVEGHTDSVGDERINRKLSLQRAEAVQEFLIAAGMNASRIKALGYGEVKPIASNMYKKGRIMNRRIDIVIEAPHG